ncbi:hypothetical protein LEMA_P103350.1 [Plenodomus lingam JN3]|uniref:Protein kinase domain-containing protein n=1 Tax=Leptosphaeria maculans (strain JN3 / isolate v23.1.3 / race Av1-4-5-6-7-8) TaxID=985895 RepID=E5A0Q8_LEPMJ|nr:hypothetical protein LEMA_P103350.1 [Plenodomus lingam JN3]CBX97204.1 hypothetical protein LEMA_P103350.1 [Plenodomus lingam JN3]
MASRDVGIKIDFAPGWVIEARNTIYGLRQPSEYHFLLSLQPAERNDFKLFATGWKLQAHNEKRPIPEPDEVIEAWCTHDAFDREKWLLLAEQQPDLRLIPWNFHLQRGVLSMFQRTLSHRQKLRFALFATGVKVASMEPVTEEQFQAIIDAWRAWPSEYQARMIGLGTRLMEIYHQRPHPRRPIFQDHLYTHGSARGPTINDISEVNDNNERFEEGERWVFEKTIYQNPHRPVPGGHSQRIVHVFARVSTAGAILERRIVKILGGADMAQINRDIDEEYRHHARLTNRGCANILDLHGYSYRSRPIPPQLGYLYMEYAPYGDLSDLLKALNGYDDTAQLPEPFLWLVFRGLAEALLLMQTGRTILPTQPSRPINPILPLEGWNPIVNPDIKPRNVVLGKPRPDYYPGYKCAKMIDFGICWDDERSSLSGNKRGFGTRGYQPPVRQVALSIGKTNTAQEQTMNPPSGYRDYPINISSEIFNVGLIIFSLMEGRERTVDRFKDKIQHDQRSYTCSYSYSLERLVSQCLYFKPPLRPILEELLYETRVGLERWERAYGSANKPEAELPSFAALPIQYSDPFPIGGKAPEEWLGINPRKRRIGQENEDVREFEAAKKRKTIDGQRAPPPPPVRSESLPTVRDGSEKPTAHVDHAPVKGARVTLNEATKENLKAMEENTAKQRRKRASVATKKNANGIDSKPRKKMAKEKIRLYLTGELPEQAGTRDRDSPKE